MTDTRSGDSPLIPVTARSLRLILVLMIAMIAFTAVEIGAPELLGRQPGYVDFHIFHLVGELFWRGDLAVAYDARALMPIQWERAGTEIFMPWTYPPIFNLVSAGLALMPLWLAYLVFASLGLGLWLWVIRRLAGPQFAPVLMMVLPALIVTLRYGQNGLYSTTLVGLFCLLCLRGSAWRGVPLGLMAYKPHLGVGLVLVALLRLDWRAIAVAAAVTVALIGAATLAFGPDIWAAFLASARESGEFLRLGFYPLFRMTSVYALIRAFDMAPGLAMGIHLTLALLALAVVVHASLAKWAPHRVLALAVLSCVAVSPYNYDYDLCILSVALALAAPDLARLGSAAERGLLFAASWLACGYGLGKVLAFGPVADDVPSFGAIGVIAVCAITWRILRRAERGEQVPALHPQTA